MVAALDVLGSMLLVVGAAFAVIGGIGLHRLPDVFARMHAGGITDTLVATSMLAGLALRTLSSAVLRWQTVAAPDLATLKPFVVVGFKLLAIWFFLTVTSPTATHALARAALHLGIRPRVVEEENRPWRS